MSVAAPSTTETQVMQVFDDFVAAARALDWERFMSFFDRSEATTWFDDGGFFARSYDGLHTALQPVFAQWATLPELHLDQGHVDILAPGAAVITGVLTMAGTFTTGEAVRVRQAATWVLVQRDGAWKMRHLQATRIPD